MRYGKVLLAVSSSSVAGHDATCSACQDCLDCTAVTDILTVLAFRNAKAVFQDKAKQPASTLRLANEQPASTLQLANEQPEGAP